MQKYNIVVCLADDVKDPEKLLKAALPEIEAAIHGKNNTKPCFANVEDYIKVEKARAYEAGGTKIITLADLQHEPDMDNDGA